MQKNRRTKVTVLITEAFQDRLEDVERSLRQAGMSHVQLLESIGAIAGEIDLQNKDELLAIPGVAAVEESQEIHLPPPDSEIQ